MLFHSPHGLIYLGNTVLYRLGSVQYVHRGNLVLPAELKD
jgi:hypothetical protein